MYRIIFAEDKYTLIAAYLLLLLIVLFDYWTGTAIASSLLYLFPIYIVASHYQAKRWQVIAVALLSSLAWAGVEYSLQPAIKDERIFYWNVLVRAGVFFTLALTTNWLKDNRRQLEEANLKLQQLNEQKNKYIGVAAHDLRSPVGNIMSLSELLLIPESLQKLSSKQQELLKMINSISCNALNLLDNLLDVTQIEAGTLKIKPEERDYVAFVKENIALNSLMATRKAQHISLSTSEEVIITSFDPTYLGQVLNNLLTNAMKYSFAETNILVKIYPEGEFVKTEVRDQGIGIREEDKERIFDPFVKTQNMPTGGERSSGLGLAIVRKIIEAHRGEIGLWSTHGQGSVFYFYLPLKSGK